MQQFLATGNATDNSQLGTAAAGGGKWWLRSYPAQQFAQLALCQKAFYYSLIVVLLPPRVATIPPINDS